MVISLLQIQLSDREGHEASRVGPEAMPLDEHMEGRPGERQTSVERRPDPMHRLLERAAQRQPRQPRRHQQAVIPLAALTEGEVAGSPLRGLAGGIAQDEHPCFARAHQPLQGGIHDMRGGPLPRDDQARLVQQPTEFPPSIQR